MARTKDPDLEKKNHKRIVEITKQLFLKKGYDNTTMNDIAKVAGMSKSTLYVYFKSKDAVKNYISLEAMQYFYGQLKENVKSESMDLHDRYMAICNVLVKYKEKYPLSFQLIVEEICVEESCRKEDEVLARIYETGEKINQYIYLCFKDVMHDNDEKKMFCKVFAQWGAIYGLIVLADNKEIYLQNSAGISKEEFLRIGFENLFQMLKRSESL